MIKNWRATAWLSSPLAGEPPAFDAILEWELSRRLGMKYHLRATRDIPLSEIPRVPIPLAQRSVSGKDIYCCSDPIIPEPLAPEWVERIARRIDTGLIALLLAPEERKSLLVASGPYKMLYKPVRVRLIDRICWFFRGDRKEVNKLLKSIFALGSHRGIGYGIVDWWEYEDMEENDYSIFAPCRGKPVLMKTVPFGYSLQNVTGYKKSFGGALPPYWHPENYMEIAVPC
jgi:hypothetical protein